MGKDSPYTFFTGTTLEYKALHKRVSKRFGTPKQCELCDRTEGTRFDWANLSGLYDEFDRDDWKRLCRFCHMKLDVANFEGKRFAGKNHSPDSRQKITDGLKEYWAKHRQERLLTTLRGKDHPRYKNGLYVKPN